MARTKRTHLPEAIDAGQITIINNSSQAFYSNVIQKSRSEKRRHGERIHIPPGNRCVIRLTTYQEDPVVTWSVPLNMYGVMWEKDTASSPVFDNEEEEFVMNVVSGVTLVLVDDPTHPIMDEQHIEPIIEALLHILQEPAPYCNIWPTLYERLLPMGLVTGSTYEISQKAFQHKMRTYRVRLPDWQNRYPIVRLQVLEPSTDIIITQQMLEKALISPGGRARIDVYWRALDRQPGGNTDQHTICYTFDCATTTVSVRTAENQDNTLSRSEYTPKNLSEKIRINPNGPFTSFLNALSALGLGDSECTILDTISMDADSYNTTWTSHEILTFLPRPWTPSSHLMFQQSFRDSIRQFLMVNNRLETKLPNGILYKVMEYAAPLQYIPVTRLHQRCVLGPQYGYHTNNNNPEPEIHPTEIQADVLETVKELVGMGRVNRWTDAGDGMLPCQAKDDPAVDLIQDESCTFPVDCFLHPYYFNFPARNVADCDQINGTSREWVNTTKRS